jgi:hypothetical protein
MKLREIHVTNDLHIFDPADSKKSVVLNVTPGLWGYTLKTEVYGQRKINSEIILYNVAEFSKNRGLIEFILQPGYILPQRIESVSGSLKFSSDLNKQSILTEFVCETGFGDGIFTIEYKLVNNKPAAIRIVFYEDTTDLVDDVEVDAEADSEETE